MTNIYVYTALIQTWMATINDLGILPNVSPHKQPIYTQNVQSPTSSVNRATGRQQISGKKNKFTLGQQLSSDIMLQ